MAYLCRVYFKCKWEDVYRIEERFKMPRCVTVNGETCQPVTIEDEDMELLRETERRGYIQIRQAKKL